MIGEIGYLGKVSLRIGSSSALLYTVGVTLGSAVVGFALGSLGMGIRWLGGWEGRGHPPDTLLPVALLALVGGMRDLRFIWFRIPQPPRQVPRGWMSVYGPRKAGLFWGLGIGFSTHCTMC
jgi:hypothetical protein